MKAVEQSLSMIVFNIKHLETYVKEPHHIDYYHTRLSWWMEDLEDAIRRLERIGDKK